MVRKSKGNKPLPLKWEFQNEKEEKIRRTLGIKTVITRALSSPTDSNLGLSESRATPNDRSRIGL